MQTQTIEQLKKGYVRFDDGSTLPYLGEVNTMSQEAWNKLCEDQAIANFIKDNGFAPQNGKQALEYQKQKYAKLEAKHQTIKEEIPVVYSNHEIITI